ncbi:MAG TPA: chemotaxis protein CheD [Clostridiales bacterium]|jgi:chemotaxis protein CheD|nr:chemotaxis protein CheD [Clostridiales bacterium]
MKQNRHSVDIAMMKVARAPDILYSLGLGSCVGVAIYDPVARVGGLIHVLLPSFKEFTQGVHSRTKFADSGIADMVEAMIGAGAKKYNMKAKIVGGAAMFATENNQVHNTIGSRNVASCVETLKKLGIEIIAQDVGGNKGRSIFFDLSTGVLSVRTIEKGEKVI